jgi:hypothetical protein
MRAILLGALLGACSISSAIAAGQIPIVDGIIGGVPADASKHVAQDSTITTQAVAGTLRVTENSGVCGMFTI